MVWLLILSFWVIVSYFGFRGIGYYGEKVGNWKGELT